METMAMELDDRCPICLDTWEEASYVLLCLHQFCYTCILRWASSKHKCPLCRRRVMSIGNSVLGVDEFKEVVIRPPAGGVPRHPAMHHLPHPVTPQGQGVESGLRAPVGGIQPDTWASLFEDHPILLQRFQPWLQHQLGMIFAEEPSTAALWEGLILCALGLSGLDEEALIRMLQDSFQEHTVTFAQQLINIAVQHCSRDARHLLGLEVHRATGEQECPAASQRGSPAPASDPSGHRDQVHKEEHPSTSAAAVHGSPSRPPGSPDSTHGEQEELP